MQGFKTLTAAPAGAAAIPWMVHTVLIPYLANNGVTVNAQGEAWLVGIGMAGLMVAMRFFTSTAIGQKATIPPDPPTVQPK